MNIQRIHGGWSVLVAVSASVILAFLYHGTFQQSAAYMSEAATSVAFADTGDYAALLSNGRYLDCLAGEVECPIEHRRKIVHHVLFFFVADGIMSGFDVFSAATDVELIWWVSPVLGAIGFLLAFALFRRHVDLSLSFAGSVTFALLPVTWVYSAVPETWVLTGICVLIGLHLRSCPVRYGLVGGTIGVLALNNFLLLLLACLMYDPALKTARRILSVVRVGAVALAVWLLLLSSLGVLFASEFLPHHFIEATVQFKAGLKENLPIVHPGRWAYNGLNGWLAPFVLNQPHLDFGRHAVLDSARNVPLGTCAVAALMALGMLVVRDRWAQLTSRRWIEQLPGTVCYLGAVFVASGLALYYESFLYAPLIVPLLLMYALASLRMRRFGAIAMWIVAAVWSLNAAQQMATFRTALIAAQETAAVTGPPPIAFGDARPASISSVTPQAGGGVRAAGEGAGGRPHAPAPDFRARPCVESWAREGADRP